ncbi:MAG TPA: NPCBM/NEW2 domain-containing protein [Bacteroidota bacterium]|nr:NPCBM/NEW2 domain-containing protein [Bacteroidota bacterium]
MQRFFSLLFLSLVLCGAPLFSQTVWINDLNLSTMDLGWGTPGANKSVQGNRLSIAGVKYDKGVGTHSTSRYLLRLNQKALRFKASVGLDDESMPEGSVVFYLVGDKKVLWHSGVMKKNTPAEHADVDLSGIKQLGLLVMDAGDGGNWDHADWCDARIEMKEPMDPAEMISHTGQPSDKAVMLTPKPSPTPRINSPKVFGVRPGNPFLYIIAASGTKPMKFSASGLPDGLAFDAATGRITGTLTTPGTYQVMLGAENSAGRTERELRIISGNTIALTPPMGWNSWNCWADAVDDAKVRSSADALVSSGLADHGWSYINIDDCWMIKPNSTDPKLSGRQRDENGMINTNKKFPDMKVLADYVHAKGLKMGIYSSPGPLTCAGYAASYGYEQKDAQRYAEWGIDYLKYDWCSYASIARDNTLPELKKPYRVMRSALDGVKRDIVYSLCQYGMGNVWEWGTEVGGNCWRTTGDIMDSWGSMAGIGFEQAGHERYAGPGHWNDPDMLVVGRVGWGPTLHPTRLLPDEQYTHISLWCLLASPLLIGCDLANMDEFTMNLLTNDEVIEVNQDPLGAQAHRVSNENGKQIWAKQMSDGSQAVGLFFTGAKSVTPEDNFTWDAVPNGTIVLNGKDLGIDGKFTVRDLWRQKDLGTFEHTFESDVPFHGVMLVKITPVR